MTIYRAWAVQSLLRISIALVVISLVAVVCGA